MHIPAPIAVLFAGPGRLVSAGLAFLAAVFAVLAEGWLGISILIIVLLALLVAELWRDSARLTNSLRLAVHERDEAKMRESATLSTLQAERDRLEAAEAAQAESLVLSDEVAWLRGALEAQRSDLASLLPSLVTHTELIQLVRKHRNLAETADSRWTILRISSETEHTATITCFVGDNHSDIEGEPVSLVASTSGEVKATGEATVRGQKLIVVLDIEQLPSDISTELDNHGESRPERYAIELAGLAIKAYDALSDESLLNLERVISAATQSTAAALDESRKRNGEAEL